MLALDVKTIIIRETNPITARLSFDSPLIMGKKVAGL